MHWIQYLWGIFAVACGYFIGQFPLVLVQTLKIRTHKLGTEEVNAFLKTNDFSILHISYNTGFFLMLMMFVGAWLGYLVLLKAQKISLISTLTSRKRFDFSRFFWAAGIWLILTLLAEVVFYIFNPTTYTFHFQVSAFVPLFIIAMVFMPLQAALEEVFFRGYVLQGAYRATQSVVKTLVISTCFFSLVHSSNPEVAKYGFATMQVYYLGAGLFLALLALVDEGLELSIGIHTATNLFGSLILKYEGSVIQTETLFEQKMANPWPMTVSFYLCALIAWLLLSRKYGFSIYNVLGQRAAELNKSPQNPI